jgi:hypothetical protein
MSRWTHAICAKCYEEREPSRGATVLLNPPVEQCCFCGQMTAGGVYYRADPATTLCKGVHEN